MTPGPDPGDHPPVAVALVEDEPGFRLGIAEMVRATDTLRLVQAAASVDELLGRMTTDPDTRPDVVLLDLTIRHQPLSGPDAVCLLVERKLTVLVLSRHDEEPMVAASFAAGAAGYVHKAEDLDELVRAIHRVHRGGLYVSAELASCLVRARTDTPLTPRETQVLRLLARGETDMDIAEELGVALRTVRKALERIREKIGYRRRVDLARWAITRGLAPLWDDPSTHR